ncbi:MAG: GIY-YIG nuclease family protein [Flavonifractor plautii]
MSWWVYILRCGDGTLYTGTAADVERRLAAHRRGESQVYPGPGAAGGGLPGGVSRPGAALRREAAIKSTGGRKRKH